MTIEIKKVNRSVLPKTSTPGRTRKPSDFDEIIDQAYQEWQSDPDNAWFEVVYDGTKKDYEFQVAELTRAVLHVGAGKGIDDEETGEPRGYGKSIRGAYDEDTDTAYTNEDGQPAFWFQVRDKYNTGRRGPRKGHEDADVDDGNGADELSQNERDAGLGEIEQSISDAKSSKHQRRSGMFSDDPVTVDHGVG